MATASMPGLFQYPKDSGRVEKPPVEIAVNAWFVASNQSMPATRKHRMPTMVYAAYIDTTSLAELVALIEKHVGKKAVIDRQPLQPGDVTITYADIEHARERLAYAPRFTMEEGIARFVDWFQAHR